MICCIVYSYIIVEYSKKEGTSRNKHMGGWSLPYAPVAQLVAATAF